MAEKGEKIYLEGFRHRDTGCLYFSAAAQSAEAAEPSAAHVGVDAECQAHYTRADGIQTLVEIETQTPAPGAPAHAGRVLRATGAAQRAHICCYPLQQTAKQVLPHVQVRVITRITVRSCWLQRHMFLQQQHMPSRSYRPRRVGGWCASTSQKASAGFVTISQKSRNMAKLLLLLQPVMRNSVGTCSGNCTPRQLRTLPFCTRKFGNGWRR
jgi:hypothetical protein